MLEAARLSHEDIKIALQHNSEFFINFFFAEFMDGPSPDFHCEIFDMLVHNEVQHIALAVPRAHAKTSLAKLAAVYHFIFTDFDYVLYMSSVVGHSVECVNDIVDFLKSDNFVQVFGSCTWYVEQEGKGYYKFRMPNGKQCILKAFGAEQKVRGTNIKNRRPQLVIVDDLEDNDNIATEELFTKLKRWVFGPFWKAVNPKKNKWIWIGNMIAQRSLLYEFCNSQFWFSRIYGAILADGSPLWPDLWPIEALRKDFLQYQERGMTDIWFAEMMNMPIMSGNGIIDADEIKYAPAINHGDAKIGFLTIDLANSKNDWGHKTVITVHAWNEEREAWQKVDAKGRRGMDPIETFRVAIELAQLWGFGVVGIESVAWQAAAVDIYNHLALIESIHGIEFVPIPSRVEKTQRIIAWAGMIKAGQYYLTEGDFSTTQELLMYDPKKKENQDDEIDSGALSIKMLALHFNKIMQQTRNTLPNPNDLILPTSYKIASV